MGGKQKIPEDHHKYQNQELLLEDSHAKEGE